MLASLLFPYDDDAPGLIDGWLDELESEDCIRRYSVDGSTYLYIPKWLTHQKIDKPSKAQHPDPPEHSPNIREGSPNTPHRKGREGKGKEEKKTAPDGDLLSGINPQVAADFKALRTKLRAPITATAMQGIQREAAAAGIGIEAALTMCCERGWRGFKAEWVNGFRPGQASESAPRQRRQL